MGAHGVLVMVFQWGWLDGLLGHHSLGFIHSMTLLLAVVATFAVVSVPSIEELGVGLAVAIALDVTLVRLMLCWRR